MSFGKNPHVAKAQDAEAKARAADDPHSRASAWREAARLWERAADRERFDKKAAEYRANADRARAEADGGATSALDGTDGADEPSADTHTTTPASERRLLN